MALRAACGEPGGLPVDSTTHFHSVASNATRAPIANPPNSAQLGVIPYHSAKLHPGPCSSVGVWPRVSVLFSHFCKHVRLSCVFLNKLTYLLTYTDARDHSTLCVVYDSRKM